MNPRSSPVRERLTDEHPAVTALVPETIELVLKPIQQFVRGWMMSGATLERGASFGLDPATNHFWIVGRAGVMGDCTWEVAAGGLGFWVRTRSVPRGRRCRRGSATSTWPWRMPAVAPIGAGPSWNGSTQRRSRGRGSHGGVWFYADDQWSVRW